MQTRDDAPVAAVLRWYAASARDLPWRHPDATAWGVLVSEVMLQQTPVARVLPAWQAWLTRWPVPAALAAEPAGEAVRMWGRLGYPRRALRLHAAAATIDERHDGQVPSSYDDLRALPGVGDYTAAAVAAFAFAARVPVLDTHVRRVLARLMGGRAEPGPSVTAAERRLAESLLPADPPTAARLSVAWMELGALVCVAGTPRCAECPVAGVCAWRRAGHPPASGPGRRRQAYAGTDRQARGALLALLRDADGPVGADTLAAAWSEPVQRERALAALVSDGLAVTADGGYALPG